MQPARCVVPAAWPLLHQRVVGQAVTGPLFSIISRPILCYCFAVGGDGHYPTNSLQALHANDAGWKTENIQLKSSTNLCSSHPSAAFLSFLLRRDAWRFAKTQNAAAAPHIHVAAAPPAAASHVSPCRRLRAIHKLRTKTLFCAACEQSSAWSLSQWSTTAPPPLSPRPPP